MNLQKRQKTLIAEMVKQRGVMTIAGYSQLLGVSERTISNDLKSIENYLNLIGYSIIRLPGIGIKVEKNNDNTDSLSDRGEFLGTVQDQRIRVIFNKILFKGEHVTYDSLSEELLVSKTSIRNDIEVIKKEYLNNSTLTLVSGQHGTYFEGNENQKQRTFARFNEIEIKKASAMTLNETLKLELLSKIYGEDIVRVCNDTLYQLVSTDINMIDDFYLFNVLNVLIVLSYRAKNGYHIDCIDTDDKLHMENRLSCSCLEAVGKNLKIQFTQEDLNYLSDHFEANKLVVRQSSEYYDEVKILIQNVSEYLDIDLNNDQVLFDQLLKHFTPMVFRLKSNIINHNPFAEQFRLEYSLLFNILTIAIHETEENLDIVFNSDEIGYVLIYFQLAIERRKASRKVLIVCPLGISASHLLMNSIQNLLPPMDVVKVASLKQLDYIDISTVDFVISTIRIEIEDLPVIVVSPILTKEDKQNILKFYTDEIVGKDNFETYESINLQNYVSESRIHTKVEVDTKEDLIELFKNEYLGTLFHEGFIESVIEREAIAGTDNPTDTAVPHGKPNFVIETGITIYSLSKKILWETYMVDQIIFVHINEEDIHLAKEILSNVYKVIKDKDSVNLFLRNKNSKQILTLLKGGSYD